MITSGFNKHITIQKEVTSLNSIGTPIKNYSFLKESWANFYLLGGGSQFSEVGILPSSDVEFTVRYDPEINYACRIKYDNQYYSIRHIFTEGRCDYTRIRCKVWEEE